MSDDRLPELYLEAAALDADGRGDLLERVRAESPELARELAALLRVPAESPSPIDGTPELPGTDASAPTFPARVGPYRILREIGKGGMGRVFLAEQETPDFRREVALKLIDRPVSDVESVRRFRDEVRLLAGLDHPGIARFLDGGLSPEGFWYLALEYVEGVDLLRHATSAELDTDARVRLLLSLTDAVGYAHVRGVVHRDLKPSNVIVGRDGRARLLDFGISKLVAGQTTSGPATTVAGFRPLTPAYASPEQLAGQAATAASDVYSLGVILYELLAGRRPFHGTPASSDGRPEPPSRAARRSGPAPGPTPPGARRRPHISRDLDAICLMALAPAPDERYPSAVELGDELRNYLDGGAIRARERSFLARTRQLLSGRRTAAVAALAIAAVVVAWLTLRQIAPPPAGTRVSEDRAERVATGRFPFDPNAPPAAADAEKRWAESPGDLVLGAQFAVALAEESRFEEARFATRRMRQVPGRELDPLTDYTEAWIAATEGEQQRALVLLESALGGALAARRGELVGGIRLLRGTTLMRLGQRGAATTELEAAASALAAAGDDALLERAWNALALERLRLGEMERCREAFEAALAAADRAGNAGMVTRSNFARFDFLRGRPDLAEAKLLALLELRRARPNALREGQVLLKLASSVHDLGRADEAEIHIDRAIELLRAPGSELSLAAALYERALFDLDRGRLERLTGTTEELETISRATLHRRTLGFARSIAARHAALTGDRTTALASFAEARQLLRSNGDNDLAADSDLAWAESEWAAGDPVTAHRVASEALAALAVPEATLAGVLAALLDVRILAAVPDASSARRRFATLAPDLEGSPSLDRRLAWLRARAALRAAEGDRDAARADLALAIGLAVGGQRQVEAAALRLDLAAAGAVAAR